MKIKLTSVYVDDQEKALRFYTEVLGFVKKTDFSNGPFRWLTVTSPEDPAGIELQLALNNNPAARTYQQALFDQNQPAVMFFTDDLQADFERIEAAGADFAMPPTDVTASKIAAESWPSTSTVARSLFSSASLTNTQPPTSSSTCWARRFLRSMR